MDNKDKIKSEVKKESPDWLMISKLALELHNSGLESNFFKFKKGKLNVIKVSQYNVDEVRNALEGCMSGDNYEYIEVGSRGGLTVTAFNKLLESFTTKVNDKYVVVITWKDQVISNALRKGLLVNAYNATIKDKWVKDSKPSIYIRNDELSFNFKCEIADMKTHVRDLKLNEALS